MSVRPRGAFIRFLHFRWLIAVRNGRSRGYRANARRYRPDANLLIVVTGALLGVLLPFAPATNAAEKHDAWRPPDVRERRTGDLPEMRQRGQIRALVNFNKTDFFIWKGQPRGFETELLQRYEAHLNDGITREKEKVRLVFIPVAFNDLLPALIRGDGDLAAAGLTITAARRKSVAFSRPYLPSVDEVLVTSANAPAIKSLLDLAGRRIHVLRGSSYGQHLRELDERLTKQGFAAMTIVEVDESLSDTDVLELVNAGIFEMTIIDRHVAELWSKLLTKMVIRGTVVVNRGGQIAWAVRLDNPKLKASLDAFIQKSRKGTRLGNILFNRYFETDYFIKNPLTDVVIKRLDKYAPLFKRFSKQYGLDWLAIAAQAYQESAFNPDRVSKRGAIGIMQIMPSTAADVNVGIDDISSVQNNIHAAVKYLAYLRRKYYSSPDIPKADRWGFMWAAYNAGPKRVRAMRARARRMGLDANRWFFNVEHAAQQVAGVETVRHVANVHKYYTAYRLSEKLLKRRATRLKALKSAAHGDPE